MLNLTCRVSTFACEFDRFRDTQKFTFYDMEQISFSLVTDQQIGTLLFRDIQYAYFDFIEDILKDCDVNPSVGRIPIAWNKPIYGDRIPNFTDFAAPGVQLT